MIAIEACREATDKGTHCRMDFKGHAGFDEAGKDIVCAAVSILFYTLAESVRSTAHDGARAKITESPGNASVEMWADWREAGEAWQAYTVVLRGIDLLAMAYPERISVTEKKSRGDL